MGKFGLSVFEFHFGRSETADSERDEREARRQAARAERVRREARRSDGGGSKLKTGLTVVGALSVVGSLAAAAWYLLRGRGRGRDGSRRPGDRNGGSDRPGTRGGRSDGERPAAKPRRRVTVLGGSGNRPVRSDAGTASLVGLAFLLTTTALVRRYLAADLAEELGERLADADEVTVVTSGET